MRRFLWLFLGGLIWLTALPVLAQDGMFFPQPPLETEVITPENASRLERLSTLGRGTIEEMLWSPDGTKFAVKSSTGVWIYQDMYEEPFFIEGRSAVFAPAWDTLATYSDDGIHIWDLQTRESYGVSEAAGQEVNASSSISFNGDGSGLVFLVNQPSGFEFWQWDVNQRRLRNSLELGSDWVRGLRMNPRGDAVLIGQSGTSVVVLDDFPELLSLHRPEGFYRSGIVFHPSEPILAYTLDGGTETPIVVFNYETQEYLANYLLPFPASATLYFSPQNELIARISHSGDQELYAWSLETGAVRSGSGERSIEDWAQPQFSPDGRYLVLSQNERYEIWDLETMQVIQPAWASPKTRFSPDGTQIAVAEDSSQVALYALENDTLIREVNGQGELVFSPTGEQFATRDPGGRSISIYPAAAEGEPIQLGGYGEYRTLGFSPDGGYLLTQVESEVALWEAPFHEAVSLTVPQRTPALLSGTEQALRFSTFIAEDGILQTWWIDNTEGTLTVREGDIFDLADELPLYAVDRISPYALNAEGDLFVGAGGQDTGYFDGVPYLYLRDLVSGRYEYLYEHTGTINSLAFSPDQTILATGSGYGTDRYISEDRTLRIYDVVHSNGTTRLTERARFSYPNEVTDVTFETAGRMIALNTWREVSVRDTLTGREIFRHENVFRPAGLTFSPDGRLLVSSNDTGLQVWSLESGEMLVSLPNLRAVSDVYFDPNGRWIATSDDSGVVGLYGVRSGVPEPFPADSAAIPN